MPQALQLSSAIFAVPFPRILFIVGSLRPADNSGHASHLPVPEKEPQRSCTGLRKRNETAVGISTGDRSATDRKDCVKSAATVGQVAAGTKEMNYLDAIAHNKYTRVPEKLCALQSASYVERPAQSEKKPAAPAPRSDSCRPLLPQIFQSMRWNFPCQ